MTAQETYIEAQIAFMTDRLDASLFHCPRTHFRNRIAALQDQKKHRTERTQPIRKTYPHWIRYINPKQKGVTKNVIQRLQG